MGVAMTVFILHHDVVHESGSVYGAFSTRELAEQHLAKIEAAYTSPGKLWGFDREEWSIQEWVVDEEILTP
jgi:hypothetical protein